MAVFPVSLQEHKGTVRATVCLAGNGWHLTRYRNKIHAKIPEPNNNVTMTMGNKTVVDAVFADTGLDVFLDGLKRAQGNSVAAETAALVANSIEMAGIFVNRIDRFLKKQLTLHYCRVGGVIPSHSTNSRIPNPVQPLCKSVYVYRFQCCAGLSPLLFCFKRSKRPLLTESFHRKELYLALWNRLMHF